MFKVHLVTGEDAIDLAMRIIDDEEYDLTEEYLEIHTTVWQTESEQKAYVDGVISCELDLYSFLTDEEVEKINKAQGE